MVVSPGRPYPLGATLSAAGCNFAVYSERAEKMELCLFDERGAETRVLLQERNAFVWHALVPAIRAGQRYGFRAHGPWDPARGLRFNPNKLLVDPYALAIDGKVDYRAPVFAQVRDGSMDTRDDAHGVPHSIVTDRSFDWRGDAPPLVPWNDTVIYEAHIKGISRLHPSLRADERGTYAGLTNRPLLRHLEKLGVTSIELLPIHECADEQEVARRGLTNYWGYSTLGFFAPDQRFAREPGQQVREFKEMVRALHAAGFEVILDVVYNHTCEGDHTGPTLSLRGLDNQTYYRLQESLDKYEDVTGCGNTLNLLHPQTLKLVTDSLRYWVTEMHVDGFRFDLASALGREHDKSLGAWEQTPQSMPGSFRMSTFFDIVHQDPVLSRCKLIAEPWDLGHGGYQAGNFPVLWTEWNGKYRDAMRRFWRGDPGQIGEVGYRLTGSSDLYQDDGRHPSASINFITAHDGFTMRDLVSYSKKRNDANGEHDRDGTDDNISDNHGVEGDAQSPDVTQARARHVRSLLATLLLSQGVPMITAGDELGKSQRGNNNAYCQDNAISWMDWELGDAERELLEFASAVLRIRRDHPVFRRRTYFRGERHGAASLKDISWVQEDGTEMTAAAWSDSDRRTVGLLLGGDGVGERDTTGAWTVDDTFLLVLHSDDAPISFKLPKGSNDSPWEVLVDTRTAKVPADGQHAPQSIITVEPRTMLVLKQPRS